MSSRLTRLDRHPYERHRVGSDVECHAGSASQGGSRNSTMKHHQRMRPGRYLSPGTAGLWQA